MGINDYPSFRKTVVPATLNHEGGFGTHLALKYKYSWNGSINEL